MPMTFEARAKARQLRGNLEAMRENTAGADDIFVDLLHRVDKGTLCWTGKSPIARRKSHRPKPLISLGTLKEHLNRA